MSGRGLREPQAASAEARAGIITQPGHPRTRSRDLSLGRDLCSRKSGYPIGTRFVRSEADVTKERVQRRWLVLRMDDPRTLEPSAKVRYG